jgi:hypothetical protein
VKVKKRVKAAKGDDKKAKAFVTENVPCDSFFNIFDPPKVILCSKWHQIQWTMDHRVKLKTEESL